MLHRDDVRINTFPCSLLATSKLKNNKILPLAQQTFKEPAIIVKYVPHAFGLLYT